MASAFGRARKVLEQLGKLSDEQADELIKDGYIAALRRAIQSGTLPNKRRYREFMGVCVLHCEHELQLWPARSGLSDPHEFFQNKKGLCVWDNFKWLILPHIQKMDFAPEVNTSVFTLVQDAADKEIQGELPQGFVFENPSIFCYHLTELIKAQWGGKEGILLNTGPANIFYVATPTGTLAAAVYCVSGDQRWDVDPWGLGHGTWRAGSRVFSAAAVA